MNRNTFLAALATACALGLPAAHAADDAASAPGLSKDDAKSLKTQSEGEYKARKKVAEANEALDRADCKAALDGAAKRACEKSAKAGAKSVKASAKMAHEIEEKQIKDATAK